MMYSPFERPLDKLKADDLESLRETAEGWFVEYKREIPKAPAIAKSIAALANTHGGWVFYGIDELSKDDPVAGSFPGIAREEADGALQRIRQAVAGLMNPAAHYEARAIPGAGGASLAPDRAVICVRVPESLAAPHVHRNGHIYRRVADGSEPSAENDRHLLERLFRRGEGVREEFADWIDRDPEFSKKESEQPYLRLMLMTDPWRAEDPRLDIDRDAMWSIFNAAGTVSGVPFETLYTSNQGYTARQVRGNNPHGLGLTWRFSDTVLSDVYIPLSLFTQSGGTRLITNLEGYQNGRRFMDCLERHGYQSPRIVDLNLLFNLLVGIVKIQRRLLVAAGWAKPYFAKARLLNVWRTVPFLDVGSVVDEFDRFGLPICLDAIVTAPPGNEPDSFREVRPLDHENEIVDILVQALEIFAPIARAWGLPSDLGADAAPPYYQQLQEAGQRGLEAQKRRNEMAAEMMRF